MRKKKKASLSPSPLFFCYRSLLIIWLQFTKGGCSKRRLMSSAKIAYGTLCKHRQYRSDV
jgi:hypothetical protein